MTRSPLHTARFRAETFAAPFDDPAIDDALLRHQIGLLLGARSAIAAVSGAATLLAVIGWAMTRDRVFLELAATQLAIGAAKLRLACAFGRRSRTPLSRGALLKFDSGFIAWSAACALVIGLTCALFAHWDAEIDTLPTAIGAAVGFPFVASICDAARRTVHVAQNAMTALPSLIYFSTSGIPYGYYYTGFILGLVIAANALGRINYQRLVSLYRINEANERLARCDSLTGLLNRYAFDAALGAALKAAAKDESHRFALISVDLDRFKDVNDTAGHAVGDAVLVETGRRLRRVAPEGAIIARLGGDEFVAIVPCASIAQAETFVERLVVELYQPVAFEGSLYPIGASVGAAIAPEHGVEAGVLTKRSDVALYAAKRGGRGRAALYDARTAAAPTAAPLGAPGKLEAWRRPVADPETGEIVAFEALARWRPSGAAPSTPPADFFEIEAATLERALEAAIGSGPPVASFGPREQLKRAG